jgi:hypothetical protein
MPTYRHTPLHRDQALIDHLAAVTRETDNLAANTRTGVLSPTLLKPRGELEIEKAD